MRKLNRRIYFVLSSFFIFSTATYVGCGSKETPKAPIFTERQITTRGFWFPNELSEETMQVYKAAGLNTVDFINHEVKDSDACFYLGSNRTQRALALCRQVGLNAYIHYGSWLYENEGTASFTERDLYGEYKDIIKGVHICDEPNKALMDIYGNDALTADFKKVYSVPYVVNLLPTYASSAALGCEDYDEYLEYYASTILTDFDENRMVSVDYYPFAKTDRFIDWLICYYKVANLAKKYSARFGCYIQSAVSNEFQDCLGEEELRLQVNTALCFGVDDYSYYCYAVPYGDMYVECLLEQDGTPSKLYYFAQAINAETQALAPAFKSYKWDKIVGISSQNSDDFAGAIKLMNYEIADDKGLLDRKYVEGIVSEESLLIGCFSTSDSVYEEGYCLTNFTTQSNNSVEVKLKNGATHLAIYGGKNRDFAKIVKANDGKISLNLSAAEAVFVLPIWS